MNQYFTYFVSMETNYGKTCNHLAIGDSLETVDAVARAAHLWVRSLCLSEFQTAEERHAIAGGLITGLCRHLELDARIRELVSYVYTLLDDEDKQALAISRLMLDRPMPQPARHAYNKGKTEAAGIVEMLGYHNQHRPQPNRESKR